VRSAIFCKRSILCPKGDGGAGKSAEELSKDVSNKYKQNGQCDKYADSLEQKMKDVGVKGERIKVNSKANIYSDKNGLIGNDFHDAIKVGDRVFDNMNPDGVPFTEWAKDLGIGEVADITWEVIRNIN